MKKANFKMVRFFDVQKEDKKMAEATIMGRVH